MTGMLALPQAHPTGVSATILKLVCPKTALWPLFKGWHVFGRGPPMDITNAGASPADPPAGSPRQSGASTDEVEAILLRPLARALLAAAVDIRAARRDGRLAVDRTRPADLRPGGRARQFPRHLAATLAARWPPLLMRSGLRSRNRRYGRLYPRQWSTPTHWVFLHDFGFSAAQAGG